MSATEPVPYPPPTEPELWGSWTVTERVDDIVDVDGIRLRRVGLTAEDGRGHVATGSAAAFDESTSSRAAFELAERAALLDMLAATRATLPVHDRRRGFVGMTSFASAFPSSDAPTRWQPSKSSGVALGAEFGLACDHAELELIERDRVLRSWLGLGPVPEAIPLPPGPWSATQSYGWEAYRLPSVANPDAGAPEVVCVVAFPRVPTAPLLRGFAAARDLDRARDRAVLECLQSLAFLWDEPVPVDAPAPSPTPLYHLDHYLWPGAHATLRAWLAGDGQDRVASSARPRAEARGTAFVDLTPAEAAGRFCVARAVDAGALALWFGDAPLGVQSPTPRGPHPIA